MVLTLLYIRLIASAMVGMALSIWFKNKSMKSKAKLSNVQYEGIWGFIKEDRKTIIGTLLTVLGFFLVLGDALDPNNLVDPDQKVKILWILSFSLRIIYTAILVLISMTVGYAGQDMALRLLSKTNTRINAAIDDKTTKIDRIEGQLDHPTPAAPPSPPK